MPDDRGPDDVADSAADSSMLRRDRAESRRRRQEIEEIEAELAATERSLTDALIDIGRQGTAVQLDGVGLDGVAWIDHVGIDVLTIATVSGDRHHIAISAVLGVNVSTAERRARVVTTGHPRSLLALVRELVGSAAPVVVTRTDGAEVDGFIVAVNAGHLELEAPATRHLVPLTAVARIRSRPNRSR